MKRLVIIVFALSLLLVLLPILFRKRSILLSSHGKVIAVAKRPFSYDDTEYGVYSGKTKLFGLWGDLFDFPVFIYPFSDGKRFLCVDDNDTSVLAFMVDFSGSISNASLPWPLGDSLRNSMMEDSTNVVTDTKGKIRLPSLLEAQEASAYISGLSESDFRSESFPSADLGVIRFYWPKKVLLAALDPNRNSVCPEPP